MLGEAGDARHHEHVALAREIDVRNFSCPAVVGPDRLSARITSHPAGRYFDINVASQHRGDSAQAGIDCVSINSE
jgi:hypothetical protein